MGLRGPVPKPQAIKDLEGNPGKRKKSQSNLKVLPNTGRGKAPPPPKRLLPSAKKEYKRLAKWLWEKQIMETPDMEALAQTCQFYALMLAVEQEMLKDGESGAYEMQTASSGYMSANPKITVYQQYYDKWCRGLTQFGLTPASRARLLGNSDSQDADEDDPMAAVLGGKW
ncbi:MAG: phage terminase small subunit P27 family [Succinivibrionaceae bacterium]|nr:phage terminase small subunit P27 family [Succinivibrionaceae bacterium]